MTHTNIIIRKMEMKLKKVIILDTNQLIIDDISYFRGSKYNVYNF